MVIYKVEHIDSGKVYIGKSKKTGASLEAYYGSGTYIRSAVNKYGESRFIKTILETCKTDEELNRQEKHWINIFNCMVPNGYNIHEGGLGGDSFHHLSKDEIKEIFDKRLLNNPEMYAKGNETKVKNGTNVFSVSHLENIKKANQKRSKDPIWREKIRQTQLDKSSMEKIFTIEILSTGEVVHLKNMREVKEFVTNYNIENQLSRKKRSNYWKLLFSYETSNMRLLSKKRAHYE